MKQINCRRLKAKLSHEACARNWEQAQDFDEHAYLHHSDRKYWGVSGKRIGLHPNLKKCKDCPQGRYYALCLNHCGVEGCREPVRVRGMCRKHYEAWLYHTNTDYRKKKQQQRRRHNHNHRIKIYLPNAAMAKITELSNDEDVSVNVMVKRIVMEYLEARDG